MQQSVSISNSIICPVVTLILYAYMHILETLHPIVNLIDHIPKKVVAKHSSIMLMCFAHGRSTVSYYWERQNNSTDNWTKISAEMNTGLFILSSVTEDDKGMYRCAACDCYSCSYSINTTTVIVYGKKSA